MGQLDLSAGPPFNGGHPPPPTLPAGWFHGFRVGSEDDEEEEAENLP